MWGGIRGFIVRPFINHAVAIFVFLSGFLTTCDLGGRTYTKFVRDRLSRVLPVYIVWSIFFTAVNGTWKDFPINIITGRCEGIYYYIFVYVQLVLFTPLIIKLLSSKCSWVGWIVSPISIVAVYYILGNTTELVFPLSGELFTFWFSYYFLGMYVRNKSEILRNSSNRMMILIYVATIVLQYAEGYVWNNLGNGTMTISQMRISSFLSSMIFALLSVRFIRSIAEVENVNGNELVYFNEELFAQNVISHMKENKLID